MTLRRLITLVCLVIFSIQLLPVKEIGRALFCNQFNEELTHSAETCKASSADFDTPNYFSSVHYPLSFTNSTNNHTTQSNSRLVNLHVSEVQTPPPDIA